MITPKDSKNLTNLLDNVVDLSYCGCAITECSCGLRESKLQLEDFKNKIDNAGRAVLDAYYFLKSDVVDYINKKTTKEEFLHELKIVLISLETHVPICDPDKLHGNHL